MKLKTFANNSLLNWLVVIGILIVVLFIIGGCAQLRDEQRVPVGGAIYKVIKNKAGDIDIEVRVANDSDNVEAEILTDPDSGKIIGFKFSKVGTKGADVAAQTTITAMEAQLEQTRLMIPLLNKLMQLIPSSP